MVPSAVHGKEIILAFNEVLLMTKSVCSCVLHLLVLLVAVVLEVTYVDSRRFLDGKLTCSKQAE